MLCLNILTASQMKDHSMFWALDRKGCLFSTTFATWNIRFEIGPSCCSALLNWMEHLSTVRHSPDGISQHCAIALVSPAFFDLLISLGQQGLITLLLQSGPNSGPRSMILYSSIKLLELRLQSIRGHYSNSASNTVFACKEPLMNCGVLTASMDLFCFYRGRLLPERFVFCDLYARKTSFFVLKVCFSMFKLFRPDYEAISLSVRELALV